MEGEDDGTPKRVRANESVEPMALAVSHDKDNAVFAHDICKQKVIAERAFVIFGKKLNSLMRMLHILQKDEFLDPNTDTGYLYLSREMEIAQAAKDKQEGIVNSFPPCVNPVECILGSREVGNQGAEDNFEFRNRRKVAKNRQLPAETPIKLENKFSCLNNNN
ncbi:hypothetical protein AVEN_58235-1 [Araneus ventricosus]|uniref:Uncharacterized protein n=1 Tax=Araneus ventricosus TaxID=182803 RepID=A0A4Y2JQZ6_ARAVE|nr:hypothetical protein AVEN_58235-1 [Araneus ventricosus]